MAYLTQPNYVKYACSCGLLKPITKMYFCRHCLKLRCGYCVCHEVDSHYCSNCLENLPSAEARLKKYRCANCYDCPHCFHTLSIRATSVTRNSEDGSKTASKLYYLACFFCRWTSRDVGIPDQASATGRWPERENENSETIASLIEYFKVLALKERIDKEKIFHTPRRNFSHFSKLGMTAALVRKRSGLPSLPLGRDADLTSLPTIVPSVASETVEPLPAEMFTTAPDLTKVTTLSQRFSQPDIQPERTSEMWPIHKHLFIKRSQRCRECEHNVYKPEYNPISIRFKIQLAAFYHIPEITLLSIGELKAGVPSEIVVRLCNPTQHLTSVDFRPLPSAMEEDLLWERQVQLCEERERKDSQRTSLTPGSLNTSLGSSLTLPASLTRQLTLYEPPRRVRLDVSSSVQLPSCGIVLPPRDDAAEYDDSAEKHNFQDDPEVVVWRKSNKAAVKFSITPDKTLASNEEVKCGFVLGYGYVNTMAALEGHKEPQRVELQVKVLLSLGTVVSDE